MGNSGHTIIKKGVIEIITGVKLLESITWLRVHVEIKQRSPILMVIHDNY